MTETIDRLVTQLSEQLAGHERALAEGQSVQLEGLEANTKNLCAHISGLPPLEAKKYEKYLQSFVERIAVIIQVLELQQQIVQQQMETLTRRLEGQNAYLKTSAYLANNEGEK